MQKAVLLVTILIAGVITAAQTGGSPSTAATQNDSGTAPQNQQIINGPVAEYVADSSATIGWSVRSSANMNINYGTDRTHMDQTADAVAGSDGRNYHARLRSLRPNTRYYFQVMQNGQHVGAVGTFQTVAPGASPIKSKAIIPQ